MNNENKEFFNNDVGTTNISEEELTLTTEKELLDEAARIATETTFEEKFVFKIEYDANQKEYLRDILQAAGATEIADDEGKRIFTVSMNMTQLKLIKRLECIERVIADYIFNTIPQSKTDISYDSTERNVDTPVVAATVVKEVEPASAAITASNETIVASTRCISGSTCNCPTNTTMETAKLISVESIVGGRICCPGAEQWFTFVVPENGTYTIHTMGNLDTVGSLYDSSGNLITTVDDYDPCGKINFRIIQYLEANATYYVKVSEAKYNIGIYSIRITRKHLVDYISISPSAIVLEKGEVYELPISPNEFNGVIGAVPLRNLSATVSPSLAEEKKVLWGSDASGILHIDSGWFDQERYQIVTAMRSGTAKLYAYDWNETGKVGECTVYVSEITDASPKVTVVSCSDWLESSETMGEDMANAFDDNGSYVIETPTNSTEFEECWKEANECIVIHTHGSPTILCGEEADNSQPNIITISQIKKLPINNKVRFIMMTACETAGGTETNNVAYWLSKRIHPRGIVIANTDIVSGGDKEFRGFNGNATWRAYKDGVIQEPISDVTLTMASAYEVYESY